jgi:hypothetical protein
MAVDRINLRIRIHGTGLTVWEKPAEVGGPLIANPLT